MARAATAAFAVLALVLVLAQTAYAADGKEGDACKTGPDCRSFICLNSKCIGAGKACTLTAATRSECKNATFTKASCIKGKYDRILTTLDLLAAPMAKKADARDIACFNATATPALDVARCVAVRDGSIGRYGLQCGAVLIRGLGDGGEGAKAAGAKSGAGSASAVAGGVVTTAAVAAVVAAAAVMLV